MKSNTKLTLKIYWQHLSKYKLLAGLTGLLVVIGSIASNFIPFYFAKFFNILGNFTDRTTASQQLLEILVFIGLISLFRWLCWRGAAFVSNVFFPRLKEVDLYNTCLSYLLKHSFGFFNSNFIGTLVKRIHRFTGGFASIFDNVVWYLLVLVLL
jgi:ATP-binding cassette subfamily B protein